MRGQLPGSPRVPGVHSGAAIALMAAPDTPQFPHSAAARRVRAWGRRSGAHLVAGGATTVLSPDTVACLDFGGSHGATLAHLRENVRITLMWCAFAGLPAVVRIHGRGEPVFRDDPRWSGLITRFGDVDAPGARAMIVVTADRSSDSCGFAVPFLDYQGERTCTLISSGAKSDDQFAGYCAAKPHNAVSIDGLLALPFPLPARSSLLLRARHAGPARARGRPGAPARLPGCRYRVAPRRGGLSSLP